MERAKASGGMAISTQQTMLTVNFAKNGFFMSDEEFYMDGKLVSRVM